MEIDECLSYPCQHAGTCTDGINNYTCSCDEGWTGTDCQTDVNHCLADVCGQGDCYSLQDSYFCRLVMLHLARQVCYVT